jgi:hypothetical protein
MSVGGLDGSGTPFTLDQQNQIKSAINFAFMHSPTLEGRLMAAITPDTPLVIVPLGVNGGEGNSLGRVDGKYYIGININSVIGSDPTTGVYSTVDGTDTTGGADGLHSWNIYGVFMPSLLSQALTHELYHAVTPNQVDIGEAKIADVNLADPNSVHLQVVDDTNTSDVESQLGAFQQPDNTSYYANLFSTNDIRFPEIQQHYSYSFGNQINDVWVGDLQWANAESSAYALGVPVSVIEAAAAVTGDLALQNDTIDLSGYSGSTLALGLEGNDIIKTGAGNDYIYGGTGNDTIAAGGGNNYIDGGQPGVSVANDGIDTADYSASSGHVNVILATPNNGEINVINGYGGSDRLYSIENIILSPNDDTVTATSLSLAGYALTGQTATASGCRAGLM